MEYPKPKLGIFLVYDSSRDYKLPEGWPKKRVEYLIIGETQYSFVKEIHPLEYGVWIGDKVIQVQIQVPSGVHKSRLLCWQNQQIELFDSL